MKRNTEGFTLIELLAVIVILAIIALIAVPVIMNIINKASKSAFKDTAYGIISAGELYYAEQLLEVNGMTEDKTFEFPSNIQGLGVKGDLPDSGSMTVTKDGKISLAVSNGKYCVTKGLDDADVTITEDVENCTLPSGDNTGGTTSNTLSSLATTSTDLGVESVDVCASSGTCEPGTAFAIKVNETTTEKFYVLSDDGNTVNLILNRNLYDLEDSTSVNVAWYADDLYNSYGPLTALAALKERTSGWTNIPIYSYTLENEDDGQGGSEGYITVTGEVVENVRARLPKYSELTSTEIGCTTSVGSCPSWLYENLYTTGDNNTSGYWLSTADSSSSPSARSIDYSGKASNGNVLSGNDYGLRPVITLSK